jgi:tetratricopeptide (TPR) repeat protein
MLVPATTFLSLACIVGLIGLAIGLARRWRLVSFCILWFFLHLVLESSVLGLEIIYEHRLYLPMFGVAVMAAYLLFRFLSRRQPWAVAIALVAVLALGAAAYKRNSVWHDELSLWSDVVSKNATSLRAQTNLGVALKNRKQTTEAIRHFQAALEIEPTYLRARMNLGNALKESGRLDEAIDQYNEALKIDPESPLVTENDFATTHSNLGAALAQKGDLAAAVLHFSEALRINPQSANAHNNLGVALAQQGDLDAAIPHFRSALALMPDHVDAGRNLQRALAIQEQTAGD